MIRYLISIVPASKTCPLLVLHIISHSEHWKWKCLQLNYLPKCCEKVSPSWVDILLCTWALSRECKELNIAKQDCGCNLRFLGARTYQGISLPPSVTLHDHHWPETMVNNIFLKHFEGNVKLPISMLTLALCGLMFQWKQIGRRLAIVYL